MSHVTWQIENVFTVPMASTSTQESVGRKHLPQNFRGGTRVRSHLEHTVATRRASRRPSRNAPTASPGSHAYRASKRWSTAPVAFCNCSSESGVARGAAGGVPSRDAVVAGAPSTPSTTTVPTCIRSPQAWATPRSGVPGT